MKHASPISLIALIVLGYFLLRIHFIYAPWNGGRAITYDPAGYYLPLPATFLYGDLAHFSFYDTLSTKYRIADAVSHTFEVPNGNRCLKYSLGMSVLYSPGFVAGHMLAWIWEAPKDGYSKPYYLALSIWSLLFSFLGLYYLRKTLLRYFKDLSVAIALSIIVLTTNYLIYAGLNNLMSHAFLFSLYCFLIFHSDRWHRKPNWGSTIVIALTIGLLALSRPTEIIAVFIPLLWTAGQPFHLRTQIQRLLQHWPKLVAVALIVGAIGSIQLVYWKLITGHWLYYSYNDQGFDFLKPHIYDGLFNFRKGWLIYTPVMTFALAGIALLYNRYRAFFIPVVLFTMVNIYLVFSWQIWWYGGSVGARAMVQSYAILLIPLTAFVEWVLSKEWHKWWKVAFFVVLILFTDLNLMMSWQSHTSGGPWHAEYMTQKYFFKIVGRGLPDKDMKKFLDTKYELRSTRGKTISTLMEHDFESVNGLLPKGNNTEFIRSWCV